jgi:hypothetical protein
MSQASTDIKQMQAQIQKWGSVTQFDVRVQVINGPAAEEGKSGYFNASTGGYAQDQDGTMYDAKWELGNWGDTMHFSRR